MKTEGSQCQGVNIIIYQRKTPTVGECRVELFIWSKTVIGMSESEVRGTYLPVVYFSGNPTSVEVQTPVSVCNPENTIVNTTARSLQASENTYPSNDQSHL